MKRLQISDDKAQAAFEFILTLPVFFLFFLLLIDFGILMYEHVSIANGVREGARYAAVNCGDGNCVGGSITTTPLQRTVGRSGGFLSDSDVSIEWTGANRGDTVVVKADHPYESIFFPSLPSIHIKSCAQMRLEQKDNGAITVSSSAAC